MIAQIYGENGPTLIAVKDLEFDNILVIQTVSIGDVLITSALCNALKLNYPGAKIDYMVMDFCTSIIENNPSISNIVKVTIADKFKPIRSSPFIVYRLISQIRKSNYDLIIDCQGNPITFFTCLFSGTKYRIGFDVKGWQLSRTDMVPYGEFSEDNGYGYLLDNRLALLKPLGFKFEDPLYKMHLNKSEIDRGKELLIQAGIRLDQPLVFFCVNTNAVYRRWDIAHFIEVAKWLISKFDAQIVLSGTPNDFEYDSQLKQNIGEGYVENVFDDIKSNLRELSALISHCNLYVGNDSGPHHIARAVDVPSLCIVPARGDKYMSTSPVNDRYVGIDPGDALGMTREQWEAVRPSKEEGETEWDKHLSPEFVISKLDELIKHTGAMK